MDWDFCRDRIEGCWLGKSIGGTMGAPYEGRKEWLEIPRQYPRTNVENDDLDLQLVWLAVIRDYGVDVSAQDLARYGWSHIVYPFDEYGVAKANLELGLIPPATGAYNNSFADAMGSPIRSEVWACLHPGRPAVAAHYAYQDAQVDHWGEGVYGEIFLAALESLAFRGGEVGVLVEQALEYVTPHCRVHQAVRIALSSYKAGESLAFSRARILQDVGHPNFTDCPQNIAFIVLGLLHGGGRLLDSIVAAATCGYDVDCTAASAGAVAGILSGAKALRSDAPIVLDDRIVVGWGVQGVEVPGTVRQLTDEVVALAKGGADRPLPELPMAFALPPLSSYERPMCIPVRWSLGGGRQGECVFDSVRWGSGEWRSWDGETLRLEFTMRMPVARRVKCNPFSNGGVRLHIDGVLRAEAHEPGHLIPAPHRKGWEGNPVPVEPFSIEAGDHKVVLDITPVAGIPVECVWLVTEENNRWLTDVTYG